MAKLFTAFPLRDITIKSRIAVSPMSQYRAEDGHANAWHMVHLGRFALDGAGLVFAEATALEQDGRRSCVAHLQCGERAIWDPAQTRL